MPSKFKCPGCGEVIQAPDSAAGKNVKCPHCETVMKVPGGTVPSPTSRPAPTPGPNTSDPFGDLPDLGGNTGAAPNYSPPSPVQNPYANASNPYASTQQPSHPAGAHYSPSTENPLNTPGIILTVLAAIHIGLAILGLILNLIGVGMIGMQQANGMDNTARMVGQIIGIVVVICVQGIIAYGGVSMRKLENRGLVWTALVLSVIPLFCSSCYILGIPFGIWGMVSMGQVSHRFKS